LGVVPLQGPPPSDPGQVLLGQGSSRPVKIHQDVVASCQLVGLRLHLTGEALLLPYGFLRLPMGVSRPWSPGRRSDDHVDSDVVRLGCVCMAIDVVLFSAAAVLQPCRYHPSPSSALELSISGGSLVTVRGACDAALLAVALALQDLGCGHHCGRPRWQRRYPFFLECLVFPSGAY
jgi:hypothetical protein